MYIDMDKVLADFQSGLIRVPKRSKTSTLTTARASLITMTFLGYFH